MRERVAAELKTTFASHYARTVSLADALSVDAIAEACESALVDAPSARRQACHVLLYRTLDEVLS